MGKAKEDPKGAMLVATDGAAAMQMAFDIGVVFKADGLELREGFAIADYQSWENIGRMIGFVGDAWQWNLGDWINWGEELFGQESAQAVDPVERVAYATRITNKSPAYIGNISRICRLVAKERRRVPRPTEKGLSFSHHEPVASLDPEEQTYWLEQAIANDWTKDELREAIREAKNPKDGEPEPPPDPSPPMMSVCERIEEVARLMYHQGQRTSDGGLLVPAEIAAQLGAALGEE